MSANPSKSLRYVFILVVGGNLALAAYVFLHRSSPSVSRPGQFTAQPETLPPASPPPAPPAQIGVETRGEPLSAPEGDALADFTRWTERYVAASSSTERAGLVAEGERLAQARRPLLSALIRSDPKRALELAVAPRVREQLPPEVIRHLEAWVSGRGDLLVLIADDFENKRARVMHEVRLGNKLYQAFLYGRRANQSTAKNLPLQGIVIDNLMAVHEDPPRE